MPDRFQHALCMPSRRDVDEFTGDLGDPNASIRGLSVRRQDRYCPFDFLGRWSERGMYCLELPRMVRDCSLKTELARFL
jgi:hypothetical protein